MATLMQASNQWATRPADQRFTSLIDLRDYVANVRAASSAKVLANRDIHAAPIQGDNHALAIVGPNGNAIPPTHWAFGQIAQLSGAPASYLRTLPAPIAADCINYGLNRRDVEEVGLLLQRMPGEAASLTAATGPNYGRVWNETVANAIISRFGDGVTGDFRVPGIWGKALTEVTSENTTLYASDRDMFVFLADETNKVTNLNRRDGEHGEMSRGVFFTNSEVGAGTLGVDTFIFDEVCQNRIVWGAKEFRSIRIRHTSGAPARWIEEAAPAIEAYSQSSTLSITTALANAKAARLDKDKVSEWLASKRFTKSEVSAINAAHMADEGRPIETVWDAVTGVTAAARAITYQDARVNLERRGGALLDLVAA